MGIPVQLGDVTFPSKATAVKHFKVMLRCSIPNAVFYDEDDDLMLRHLLLRHYDLEIRNTDVQYFYRGETGFRFIKTGGGDGCFSYKKCIEGKDFTTAQKFKSAARNCISPFITAHRNDYFNKFENAEGKVPCEITGELLLPNEVEVDHVFPMTFEKILKTFTDDNGIVPEQTLTVYISEELVFADEALKNKFIEYHNSVAALRVVSQKLNAKMGSQDPEKISL